MTVANKRIRVSSDDVTFYTLPGNTASLTQDGAVVDDTVFGQAYKSEQPTLINSSITSPAFYKGFAGYVADLKQVSGSSTTFTDEATTLLSGKDYQINNTAKRIWDRTATFVVKDGAVDHTADVEAYDYLFGVVRFKSTYTVTGAVTVSAKYFATSTIAKGNNFTLTMTAEATETTDFETAQANGGIRTFQQGLKTVNLEIKGFYDVTNAFYTELTNRSEVIVEINPEGNSASIARGFFRMTQDNLTGNVGAIEEENIKFNLTVPSDDFMLWPFRWRHVATTLSTAVQKVIDAWQDGTSIKVQYLPDGTTGKKFTSYMTSISLAGGVDGMNVFSCTFQNSGAGVAVP